MKIYKCKVDVATYQWIMPECKEENLSEWTMFDCSPRSSDWQDIDWYVYNPKKKKGNFFALDNNGVFAFDQSVYDSDLFPLFEMSGEILPINVKDLGKLYLLNVMDCVNMLDEKATQWRLYEDGTRSGILKHEFHSDRLGESSIFKIPETDKIEILTYSGVKNAADEFYGLYQKLGFTGLIFEEIYTK